MIGVAYDTPPEKIDAYCEGIRELIRRHPYTRKDYFHVYLNEFADSSLNVLLYVFWEVPDWATELRERHRLFLDLLRLADRLGVEFAFPTRTIHMHPAEADVTVQAPKADDAHALGRRLAGELAQESWSEQPEVPAPVRFDRPGDA